MNKIDNQKNLFKKYLILIVLTIILSKILLTEIVNFWCKDIDNILLMVICQVIGVLLPCVVFYFINKKSVLENSGELRNLYIIENKKFNWLIFVYAILLGIIIGFATLTTNFAFSKIGFDKKNIDFYNKVSIGYLFLLFLVDALLPAIIEEFLYRDLGSQILNNYGNCSLIIIISLLFAFGHCSVVSIIMAFIVSIILVKIYLKTRNILYCIVVHFISNLINILFTRGINLFYNLNLKFDILNKNQLIGYIIILFVVALFLLCVAFGIVYLIKDKSINKDKKQSKYKVENGNDKIEIIDKTHDNEKIKDKFNNKNIKSKKGITTKYWFLIIFIALLEVGVNCLNIYF